MITTLPRRAVLNYVKSSIRLFIIFLFNVTIVKAQLPPVNPSFEGAAGGAPAGWSACGSATTIAGAASNGANFVQISNSPALGREDGISQKLSCTLQPGNTYSFSIDLQATDTTISSFTNSTSGEIEIWCGSTSCGKQQLLWSSPTITNYAWQTFSFTISPTMACDYLTIIAACQGCTAGGFPFGEHTSVVNIDNLISMDTLICPLSIKIDSSLKICKGKCATVAPVLNGGFTPYTYQWDNGLPSDSSVSVCPSSDTKYSVSVTDSKGTVVNGSVNVVVDANPNCGQTGCCINGVCEKGNGEKYPDCPDCPCYNAYGPFFNNPNPTSTISKSQAQGNGWCYTIPDSLFPGTFCFTYRHPVATTLSLDLHITPQGCTNTFSTVTNQIHSSGGPGCSNAQNTTNSNGFIVNNWRTYDSQCSLISNTIRMGCGLVQDSLYVVCVDISAPNGTGCNAVEICPIINCYNGKCGPDYECSASNLSVDVITKPVTCFGGSDGSVSAFPCGTLTYSYQWNDPQGQTTPTATGLKAGTYQVILTDSGGCFTTVQAVVTEPPPVVADAGSDALVCKEKEVTLGGNPTGPLGSTFSWAPTTDINIPTSANPIVKPTLTGNYIVTVTDSAGCTDQDSVKVTVKACEIIIPNIFTPVGNGVNDKFVIKGLDQYPNTHIKIFNRWGVLIYENDNYLNDWDGRHYKTLSRLNEGVYYYIVTLPSDEGDYHGFVTLVRGYKF